MGMTPYERIEMIEAEFAVVEPVDPTQIWEEWTDDTWDGQTTVVWEDKR